MFRMTISLSHPRIPLLAKRSYVDQDQSRNCFAVLKCCKLVVCSCALSKVVHWRTVHGPFVETVSFHELGADMHLTSAHRQSVPGPCSAACRQMSCIYSGARLLLTLFEHLQRLPACRWGHRRPRCHVKARSC